MADWILEEDRQKELLAWAFRFLGHQASKENAEDALQSFFEKTYVKIVEGYDPSKGKKDLSGKDRFLAYFLKSFKNHCLRHKREIERYSLRLISQPESPWRSDGVVWQLKADGPDLSEDPDERLRSIETRRALEECLRHLPAHFSEVIVMHYFDELDTASIAKKIGVTPENVRIRLHRAKRMMKGLLRKRGWGNGDYE